MQSISLRTRWGFTRGCGVCACVYLCVIAVRVRVISGCDHAQYHLITCNTTQCDGCMVQPWLTAWLRLAAGRFLIDPVAEHKKQRREQVGGRSPPCWLARTHARHAHAHQCHCMHACMYETGQGRASKLLRALSPDTAVPTPPLVPVPIPIPGHGQHAFACSQPQPGVWCWDRPPRLAAAQQPAARRQATRGSAGNPTESSLQAGRRRQAGPITRQR